VEDVGHAAPAHAQRDPDGGHPVGHESRPAHEILPSRSTSFPPIIFQP
jgi:hypothetical protein